MVSGEAEGRSFISLDGYEFRFKYLNEEIPEGVWAGRTRQRLITLPNSDLIKQSFYPTAEREQYSASQKSSIKKLNETLATTATKFGYAGCLAIAQIAFNNEFNMLDLIAERSQELSEEFWEIYFSQFSENENLGYVRNAYFQLFQILACTPEPQTNQMTLSQSRKRLEKLEQKLHRFETALRELPNHEVLTLGKIAGLIGEQIRDQAKADDEIIESLVLDHSLTEAISVLRDKLIVDIDRLGSPLKIFPDTPHWDNPLDWDASYWQLSTFPDIGNQKGTWSVKTRIDELLRENLSQLPEDLNIKLSCDVLVTLYPELPIQQLNYMARPSKELIQKAEKELMTKLKDSRRKRIPELKNETKK